MKTAERILLVSLELFNHHGEANVSSVDIANELDISPGNLYYHFKGKEIIIAALFEMYEAKMNKALHASTESELSLEEFFYYLYLIFEISHTFRFLYRNPAELAEKYPPIAKGFRKTLVTKEKVFSACLNNFRQSSHLKASDKQIHNLVELMGLIGTQMLNYRLLKNIDPSDGEYIYQSITTILFALAPYMQIKEQEFESLAQSILSLS
ncbi:TetR/AcrR family transcriptional regulator [Aliikangiella marina]|uniref:TetR/AcrR family transcriptional regulator n=1 Tax=Aliikangiella marina TaxID=1712262 RepID=A0A545THA3_9GAMM|nr:TetR/AcrR family transcriptional regulator [Aliikangiella marina]TQV76602.1 TetR/AcrR family transcriptional regulator [Aliikangiella marina]